MEVCYRRPAGGWAGKEVCGKARAEAASETSREWNQPQQCGLAENKKKRAGSQVHACRSRIKTVGKANNVRLKNRECI